MRPVVWGMAMGEVLQVNVGRAARVTIGDQQVPTAIVKQAVAGPARLADDHVGGDVQADTTNHGGHWQAVYAYARSSYDTWEQELGRALPNGWFGENLTLSGIDCDSAVVGEQWRIGTAVVAVTAPRIPCRKLGWRMEDPSFVTRFLQADRTGSYLRIVEAGEVAAGDEASVRSTPEHGVTILHVLRLWRGDRDLAGRVLTAGSDLHPVTAERARHVLGS